MKQFTLLALFAAFVVTLLPHTAHARIDILPRKIVLESRERSAEITVMNLSDNPGLFRVSFLAYRQNPDGTYQALETPLDPAFDPEGLVRISPKQFTLPAHGRQKIRMAIKRPADLADGEYRFHVQVMRYNTNNAIGNDEGEDGPKVNMRMNVGVAIPVVVRKGELSASATISNVRLVPPSQTEDGRPALSMDITREGQAGILGQLQATWQPAQGEPVLIGQVDNVNVFPEITTRSMQMSLKGIPQGAGSIRVRYVDEFGNQDVIDEILLQP